MCRSSNTRTRAVAAVTYRVPSCISESGYISAYSPRSGPIGSLPCDLLLSVNAQTGVGNRNRRDVMDTITTTPGRSIAQIPRRAPASSGFCACATFVDQPREYACSVVWPTQHIHGNVVPACCPPLSHVNCTWTGRPRCAVRRPTQVNDTGSKAKRRASSQPHKGAVIPGRVQVFVPALSADQTVHALCTRCCMLRAVGIKTLPCFVPLRPPAVPQRAQDRAHGMHFRT
jgi:hypothetical protein